MKRAILAFLTLGLVCVLSGTSFADLNDGLVAYYPFNGNAEDESGNGNHGTVYGATLTEDRFGNPESAYMFGGLDASDYIEVPNDGGPFDLVDSWTLVAWAKPTEMEDVTPGPIIWKIAYPGGNADTFALFWITGSEQEIFGGKLERASDGSDFVVRSNTHQASQWYCAVGIYDGNDLKLYVDGVLEDSLNIGPVTAYTGPAPLRIGDHRNSNHGVTGAFHGIIDDVRIYDRALSDEELQQLCPTVGDTDTDGDGIDDDVDNCPNTPNSDQSDADEDGIGNACDNCPDIANPGQEDGDTDGIGSACDNCPLVENPDQWDTDEDGVGDLCDICFGSDNVDRDADGMCDASDNCPDDANPAQEDFEGDAIGDACDNCPGVVNPGQSNSDGDVYGDACDNCPNDENEDQANNDGDLEGDVCDQDDDNDSILDGDDNCPLVANSDQADWDGDGQGDVCDDDDDGDGVPDAEDSCVGSVDGVLVDEDGCSGEQLVDLSCPCDSDWKNHGEYVSCVAHAAGEQVAAGLLSEEEKGAIVSARAKSGCGKKKK